MIGWVGKGQRSQAGGRAGPAATGSCSDVTERVSVPEQSPSLACTTRVGGPCYT